MKYLQKQSDPDADPLSGRIFDVPEKCPRNDYNDRKLELD